MDRRPDRRCRRGTHPAWLIRRIVARSGGWHSIRRSAAKSARPARPWWSATMPRTSRSTGSRWSRSPVALTGFTRPRPTSVSTASAARPWPIRLRPSACCGCVAGSDDCPLATSPPWNGLSAPNSACNDAMPLIGYARVSTEDQDTAAQTDALRAAGCTDIVEERASGASRTRPLLARLLARILPGDTLVVVRIDRLARSLAHLLAVIDTLRARGAHFRSLGDPIDTSSPQGLFTLQVLGAAAEFERALIRERTRAGLAAARARGRIGGNPALRARDPAARAHLAAARRSAALASLIASAEDWLPVV